MKYLYLIRHAKSSWKDENLADFDRPLNKRGKRNAPFMAEVLKNNHIFPDYIVTSGANRALSTANIFCKILEFDKSLMKIDNKIYDATKQDLVEVVQKTPDDATTLFLFGHNPSFNEFANFFTDFKLNIPTCGIYGIVFKTSSWKDIAQCDLKEIFFDFPKRYH